MSVMRELAYDIEQLWIEGRTPVEIADQLDCHIDLVTAWLEQENLIPQHCRGYAC